MWFFLKLSSKCSVPNLLFPWKSRIFPLFKTSHSPCSLTRCVCARRYEVGKWKWNIYAAVNFYFSFVSNSLAYITQTQREPKINWNERLTATLRLPNLVTEPEESWHSSTLEGSRPKVEWVTISIKGLRNDYHFFVVIFEDQCKVIFPELDRWSDTILS